MLIRQNDNQIINICYFTLRQLKIHCSAGLQLIYLEVCNVANVTQNRILLWLHTQVEFQSKEEIRIFLSLSSGILWGGKNNVALVHKQTILTGRPPFVGEVSANFCG
jgi:hypothetical protein